MPIVFADFNARTNDSRAISFMRPENVRIFMESAKFFVKRFAIYSIWAGEIMKMSLVIFAGLSGFAWFFIFVPYSFFVMVLVSLFDCIIS